MSIFKNGKLVPGVYKIQNVASQTYLDMREHTRGVCCRPAALLDGKGLWEILPLGSGYTIRRLDAGDPEQFCVTFAHDERYPGSEYVRFFWGTTNNTWDLKGGGSDKDLTPVEFLDNRDSNSCRIWKLIPVKFDTTDPVNQFSRQITEINGDDKYETTVVETTVTTTNTKTITTRKK